MAVTTTYAAKMDIIDCWSFGGFAVVHILAAVWPINPSTCFWKYFWLKSLVNSYTSQYQNAVLEAWNRRSSEILKFQEGSMSLGNMDVIKANHFFIGKGSSMILPVHFMRETGTFVYHLFIEQYLFALPLITWIINDGYHFIMRTV